MLTKIKIIGLAVIFATLGLNSNAQMNNKHLSKQLKAKVNKDCRKTAKALTKDGWKVMPGKLPIEKQIQEGRFAQLNENEKGAKLYFTGTQSAIGGNYATAKQVADSRARLELARQINSLVKEKVKDKIASNDFGDGDIETINEFFSANEATVVAQLQGVVPMVEIYRPLPNNQYEVQVMVAILREDAFKTIRRALKENLDAKTTRLLEEIE